MNKLAGACALVAAAALSLGTAAPADAQLYFQQMTLPTGPILSTDPSITQPGATQAESDAFLLWNLRAALNVAALQCDLAKTLRTVDNYNAILLDHQAELKRAFDTAQAYFVRQKKSASAGLSAFDQYGTRVYSSYSTVVGHYTFCQVAHSVGRDAVFAPRGQLLAVAQDRLRELRGALVATGEQYFPDYRYRLRNFAWAPDPDKRCWKSGKWNGKCPGPAATQLAAS